MSRSDLARVLFAMLCCAASGAASAGQLGRPATVDEIAAWDIDVRPDGQGLPRGSGTVAEGQVLYDDKCASCHGVFGESTEYMAIAGGVGSLGTDAPVRTVGSKLNYATTLWDYVYRAMPFAAPKSLGVDETYAIVAYVLHLNDILPADARLDQDSLPKVQMPNRDGYTTDHGMATVDGKPDVRNRACMKNCEAEVEITSRLPDGFVEQLYGDISTHFRHYGRPIKVAAPAPAEASVSGAALARQYACTACHGIEQAIVGPGFRAVYEKYRTAAAAEAELVRKLAEGTVGAWGAVPMPPQAHVPPADREALVRWILSGASDDAPGH
ncbi:c-type cytochrome [Sinimarinibacterium thermocellulolyticum]|uniref:Cytochrome c-551 n=1 Tax=Sinimarinibacterium thermocellulolyticum TaxID=3170016 RepID=A0ABV2ABT5_9GAMM